MTLCIIVLLILVVLFKRGYGTAHCDQWLTRCSDEGPIVLLVLVTGRYRIPQYWLMMVTHWPSWRGIIIVDVWADCTRGFPLMTS